MILTINDVDSTADKCVNAQMDGWDLLLFDPKKDGFTHKNGYFRDGKWQVCYRIKMNEHGIYRVPKSLERLIRSKGAKSKNSMD